MTIPNLTPSDETNVSISVLYLTKSALEKEIAARQARLDSIIKKIQVLESQNN